MKPDNPFISVVMPVYNGEKYLRDAIDSVLNQSYTNFEFIIINDGSTDSSEDIILSYHDKRIRYHKQQNSGVGLSLTSGCSIADGKYIARMDSDDICYSERFSSQIEYLENHPDTVLVSSAVRYINDCGEDLGRSFPVTANFAIKRKLKYGSPICHPCVMMRKDAYTLSEGYIDLEPLEDLYLWNRLSKLGKLHNLGSTLLKYRLLDGSVSRSISNEQYKLLIKLMNKVLIEDNQIDENIVDFKKTYIQYKIVSKSLVSYPGKYKSMFELDRKTKKEYYIYNLLRSLRIPESLIAFIICTLKNIITYVNSLVSG